MKYGYMGKILLIDLDNKKTSTESYSNSTLSKYIGGSGLGAKILYEETSKNTDPLGGENPLIFMTGPLTGTNALSSGRCTLISKSPLTSIWGESNVGGNWGVRLKQAGYDGIIIKGRSREPVYLSIDQDNVEIRKADHLWGIDTYLTTELIKKDSDKRSEVACIGPAGERLIPISNIIVGGRDSRAAGRCGMGAVMGSKKLKAIVVNGSKHPQVMNKPALLKSVKEGVQILKDLTGIAKKYGTALVLIPGEMAGDLPVKNWQLGSWKDKAEKISGQTMADTILTGSSHCANCVLSCGRRVKVEEGPFSPVEGAGPEYQTLVMFGSNCLIDNLEAIARANELCNRFGLDTISTGSAVAFAFEAYERGIISKKDTGGIELKWGDAGSMIGLVNQIAHGQYLGELLAGGIRKAAAILGGEAQDFCIQSKGLAFPGHDPRAEYSSAVAYATSNRGACHLQAYAHDFELDGPNGPGMPELGFTARELDRFSGKDKGIFVARMQNLMSMFDSMVICKFIIRGGIKISMIIDWFNYVTGWDVDLQEFMNTGERLYNLKRLYNTRCGISSKDDTIPKRILNEAAKEGPRKGKLPPFKEMLSQYYEYRGWDKSGIPLPQTLQRLNIKSERPSGEVNGI